MTTSLIENRISANDLPSVLATEFVAVFELSVNGAGDFSGVETVKLWIWLNKILQRKKKCVTYSNLVVI